VGGPAEAAAPSGPAVDESGPMFLDEDPSAPAAEQWPAAGQAPVGQAWGGPAPSAPGGQEGAGRTAAVPEPRDPLAQGPAPSWPDRSAAADPHLPPISWGAPAGGPGPAAEAPSTAMPAPAARPVPAAPAQPQQPRPQPAPAPGPRLPQPGQDTPQAVLPPQQQASPQPGPSPLPLTPAAGQASPPWAAQVQDLARGEGGVVPWRPPTADPFGVSQGHDRPGGLVRRFVARIVDTLLLAAVTSVAAVPLGTAAYHHAKDKVDSAKLTGETVKVWLIDGTTGVQLGLVVAVFLVAGVLLEVLPTARWGRTLGKRLVGLRVLDIEAQLPPGFGASTRRWLTRTVLDLLVVGVVGLAWCLFDRPWKQCWHDKAAHTFVAAA
jgi:uncharacterized RDD family membrane protein YckC